MLWVKARRPRKLIMIILRARIETVVSSTQAKECGEVCHDMTEKMPYYGEVPGYWRRANLLLAVGGVRTMLAEKVFVSEDQGKREGSGINRQGLPRHGSQL